MTVNFKDSELLSQLSKNGKASQRDLSKETGLALGTVNAHIKKLEKEKIIKGYFADIDPEKVGFNLTAIINLRIRSVLDGLNSSFKISLRFSNKSSSLSIVPETVSLINFLYLCLGKFKSKSLFINLLYIF